MRRSFERSFSALGAVFESISRFFEREGIDAGHRQVVDLAVEELFTNFVKYNPESPHRILMELSRDDVELAIVLTDFEAEPFDITALPEVDVDRPLAEREPGGLGIHLIREMMDRVEYVYDAARREGRTTMIKSLRG